MSVRAAGWMPSGVVVRHVGRWCPCGHALDSGLRCLNGRIYGPCASEHCDGPCTGTYGDCDADICLCEEDENE